MESFFSVNGIKGNPILERFAKYSILSPPGTSITDGKVLKKKDKLTVLLKKRWTLWSNFGFTDKRHSNSLSGSLLFKGCKIYNFS